MGIDWSKLKKDFNKLQEVSKDLEEKNEEKPKKDFSDLLGLDDDSENKEDKDLSELIGLYNTPEEDSYKTQEYEIKRLEARVDSLEKIVKSLIEELEDQKS